MFEDAITYSFVNLFTNEDVISRTTRVSYGLGRGNGCKMTKHLSSMGKKTLVARALGNAGGQ